MASTDIRTSIDVNLEHLSILEEYAQQKNVSISAVMTMILDKHAKKLANNPQRNTHAMRYRDRGEPYESRHIRLTEISYSQLRDIMILFRYSLSYMLSLAMKMFEEYTGDSGDTDSYTPRAHSCIVTMIDCAQVFASYWGVPLGDHEIEIPG